MTTSALILPEPLDPDDIRRWGLAAAMVLMAHLGFAAAYLWVPSDEPYGAPEAPAVIIDLAPIAAAPKSNLDLAPGPEMQEARPVPEPTPPKPEAEQVPKVEAPSDVVLPQQEKVEKLEKKEEVQASPAPQTTAPPRSQQHVAPKPAAPSVGSEASRAAIARWRDLVVAKLQAVKRYPSGEHGQGTVTLSFSVDRNGRVLSRNIVRSSGVPALDHEVLSMIERAQPLPSFPAAMTQMVVHLTVPVRFALR